MNRIWDKDEVEELMKVQYADDEKTTRNMTVF